MNKRLLILTFFYVSFFIFYTFTTNFDTGIAFINEPWERILYFERGSWLPLNQVPYKECFCEYPQVAAYIFALPFLFIDGNIQSNLHQYLVVFSFLMLLFSFFSIKLLFKLTKPKQYFWLLLLPSSLFCTLSLFDIVPAFLCLLALYFLYKEYFDLSCVVLAIGFLTKWYPVLLLPVFMVYYFSKFKKIKWSMFVFFLLTAFVIILPTLINGVQYLLVPYKFQARISSNTENLFYLIRAFFKYIFNINFDTNFTRNLFLLLQFSIIPLCLTSKIDDFSKVIKWSTLSILVFMLFCRRYSPQWILWVMPFLILNIKNRKDVFKIIIFDLVHYLYYPVFYYIFGPYSSPFLVIILIKTYLLIVFVYPLFKELLLHNKLVGYFQSKARLIA